MVLRYLPYLNLSNSLLFKKHSLFVLLLISSICTAQLEIKNLSGLTGKKEAPVQLVYQDLDGYLYAATAEGLYKYNGIQTKQLFADHFRSEKHITAIYSTTNNVLWLGTADGSVYTITKGKLDSITLPKLESSSKITAFATFNNKLFAASYGNGIFEIDGTKVTQITTEKGLSDNVVYSLCQAQNYLWCATDGGITQFKLSKAAPIISTISTKDGLPDNIVRDLYFTGKRLLVAMQDSGVCSYYPDKNKLVVEAFFREWSLGPVVNVVEFDNGVLNIATEREGLLQVQKGRVSIYKYGDKIKADRISQMYCDREKSLWLVSQKGLSQLVDNRYKLLLPSKDEKDKKVLALATDQNNDLWVATEKGFSRIVRDASGGLNIWNEQSGQDFITSCAITGPDGNPWFGTYGKGIAVFDAQQLKKHFLNVAGGDLTNDNVSSIFTENGKDIYVATLGGGIIKVRYNEKTRHLEKIAIYTEEDGLGSNYVYAAITGTDGVLYAATDGGGLQKLENGSFINLTKKFGFKSSTAFSLCKDPMGHITATSNEDGILHYDGNKLTRYRANEGLRDEQPAQIISSKNNLLCIHSKGIDKINCANNVISYYDLPETDYEANLNAVAYHDGYIYSGTSAGIIVYRTGKQAYDSLKPKVHITNLFLSYKPIPADSLYEYSHNQNNLGFAFEGIWLKRPTQLHYRYRLAGLEDEWQISDEAKTVNYNNLAPGEYSFIVQAQNDEDMWSDAATYSFIINTPIWKRWWFWVLAIVLGVSGIYMFVRYRLVALQKENAELERRVTERTEQIAAQSRIIAEKNKTLEQLSLVASKTDNVVLILDAEGNLEYTNESFEKLHGVGVDVLIAEYGRSIYGLSNNANISSIITDAIKNKRSVNYESLNKKVKDQEFWESSTLTPIFDDEGKLRKIIIIDTDVTLRKKQEQIIVQKNKDITDSIFYAKKIQHAILPPVTLIRRYLPDSFVLYMTKDIVSGDFFWFGHFENYSIIAAIDCTGHGVPGAFMSLIGYSALNRIVNEQKIHEPSKILEALNLGVISILHKNDSESKDGMDIAICKIDHKSGTLWYAGAMRPLWIVNGNNFTEIKADKIPIGTKPADREGGISYTTHQIEPKEGDYFYVFTDGYADQFGGDRDKKYSTGRFKEYLIGLHGKDSIQKEDLLREEHQGWKGQHEQVDDILVIGFSTKNKSL